MKILKITSAALLLAGLACATTPTGRRALHLLPDDQMAAMGATAFQELKKEMPPAADPQAAAFVRCVTSALIPVLPGEYAKEENWEVQVFNEPSPNAFALPGGKVGVHTGIFKVATNEHQLATVLAHELAHVLAEHGNERVSQQLAAQSGLALISVLASTDDPAKAQKRQLLLGLLGLGAQVGILLPFSRTQESESDRIGLELMARAGFDPQQSVRLWHNMEKLASGGGAPEFLSTHPSHGTRIQDLQNAMGTALAQYQDALRAGRNPSCARSAPLAAQ